MRLDLGFVLKSSGGTLVKGKMPPVGASGVSIDSRSIKKNQIFIAIKGENFDGHDYVSEAFEKGAAAAIVQRDLDKLNTTVRDCGALVMVKSTEKALLSMAAQWRNCFSDLKLAAITGSNGKTTTKNMTHSILSVAGNVLSTYGNLNNQIGLPLSLLKLEPEHDFCVLEMGMNSFGEIRTLTRTASPQVGAITNIARAHIEEIGGLDGVAKAKGELVEDFSDGNTFCVNLDDQRIVRIAKEIQCRKITYGIDSQQAFIRAEDINPQEMQSIEFTISIGRESSRTRIRGIGVHNVLNALCASALGYSLGLEMNQILAGLEKYTPSAMRLEVMHTKFGFKIINDCYNANPDSMNAALDELAARKQEGVRTVAVLGDMLELGKSAEKEHEMIGETVSRLGLDMLIAMGEYAERLVAGVKKESGKTVCHLARNPENAAALILDYCDKGDTVLVKGSRGMKMERVIENIYKR